jgi:hypothetical protein
VTTVAQAIDVCRNRYLLGGQTEPRNKLAAPYTAGQSQLTFAYDLNGIQAGARIQVGLNVFYVWASDTTSKTATVVGGQFGTTDVLANTGDLVTVNPRYLDQHILDAMNEDLASLSSAGLFFAKTAQFAYNPARVGYDLAGVTDVAQIIEVRFDTNDAFKGTPRFGKDDWRLERGYSTSDNSSTFSLKLFRGGVPGRNVTVIYKAPFVSLSTLGQDVAAVSGLPGSAVDLPPMGAAIRLGVGREVRRNDTASQGDTRRAEEVGPGAVAASWRGLMGLRQTRIAEETQALAARWPVQR